MTVTRGARERVKQNTDSAVARVKAEYRDKILAIPWAAESRRQAHQRYSAPPGPERAVLVIGSPAAGKSSRVDPLLRRD